MSWGRLLDSAARFSPCCSRLQSAKAFVERALPNEAAARDQHPTPGSLLPTAVAALHILRLQIHVQGSTPEAGGSELPFTGYRQRVNGLGNSDADLRLLLVLVPLAEAPFPKPYCMGIFRAVRNTMRVCRIYPRKHVECVLGPAYILVYRILVNNEYRTRTVLVPCCPPSSGLRRPVLHSCCRRHISLPYHPGKIQ